MLRNPAGQKKLQQQQQKTLAQGFYINVQFLGRFQASAKFPPLLQHKKLHTGLKTSPKCSDIGKGRHIFLSGETSGRSGAHF